jgi:hypothetical protein
MIYESPDKGQTVYQRDMGSLVREILTTHPDKEKFLQELNEDNLWRDIRHKAKENIPLRNALEQVHIIYNLIKDE